VTNLARFGVYELDVPSGELRRSGIRVPLQDQPVRLLAYLLGRAGEVVTREELQQQIWPSDFVDFDHSLNTAIRKLRAALDDSAENPRFVETLARRGYRFIAPVSWNGETAQPARSKAIPRKFFVAGIAAVAIAIAAMAIFFFRGRPSPVKTVASIAVLPFTNADPGTQHVSDALTEQVIDAVSRVPDLRVMAPATVFRFRNADPIRTGRSLDVAAVVAGRIRRENDKYVVRIELIDVSDGAELWATRYNGAASDLPAIGEDLAALLRHGVAQAGNTRTAHATTPEAYDLYTRGMFAWNRRGKEDLQAALGYFTAATQRDPNFSAAYAGIAMTYGVMVGYGSMSVAEGTPKIVANAQKALDLDPTNAEAIVTLATSKYRAEWDFAGADADYKRALAINPNYATGHQWYADLLRSMGRWDEARREVDTAYKLDPYSTPVVAMKCFNSYYERRYDQAIAFAKRAAAVDSRLTSSVCTMRSYLALGDIASAATIMRHANLGPFELHGAEIADAWDRGGPKAFYEKWCEVFQRDRSRQTPVDVAIGYAQLGDRDRAFQWLERAYDERVSTITNINIEPALDTLHGDPRWDDLLRRIGLPKVQPPR
jgi:DNA-binding winged helix-turn-helix (wHTH) protein/TolB-like protein